MTAHPRFPTEATPVRSPGPVEGQGLVIALGHKPVAVAYTFKLGTVTGGLTIIGATHSRRATLRAMWLEPTVMLRLANGRHVDIAITDFDGRKATFEALDDEGIRLS